MTVERNGDLAVTETIAVQAEGRDIRRGILRDFPTDYRRRDGGKVEVGFDVLSVTRDGAAESYTTERLSNGVRVRIGSADRLLNTGPHDLRDPLPHHAADRILPRLRRALLERDRHRLDLRDRRSRSPHHAPRTGARSSRPRSIPGRRARADRTRAIVEQQPGRIVFRTTRPLPPNNGLTVAAAWQKGVVTPPGAAQQAQWLLADNQALAVSLIGLILAGLYYLVAWMLVGRDPPKGTIIPLFGPPAGMSAAGVRYVDQMGFDNRAFTAAIIELGVNGHLKLSDHGKISTVTRNSGGKPVGAAEAGLEKALFQSDRSLALTQTNHERISAASAALKAVLVGAYKGKLFANNLLWSSLGLLLAIVAVIATVVTVAQTYPSDQVAGSIAGLLIPVLPVMFAAGLAQSAWRAHAGATGRLVAAVIVVAVALAIGLGVTFFNTHGVFSFLPVVLTAVLAFLAVLAFAWLQAPTVAGRKVKDEIDGFREYLGVAEEERLEYLNPPDKTPELFERFLPYAVALDVENTWAKRFAGVLAAAAAGAAAGYAASSWYSGNRDIANDPVSFANHIGSELSTTIASASTPPGSSGGSSGGGSSGGGSSGGGGGGGGGSGW